MSLPVLLVSPPANHVLERPASAPASSPPAWDISPAPVWRAQFCPRPPAAMPLMPALAPGDARKDPCGTMPGSAAAAGYGAAHPRRGAFSLAKGARSTVVAAPSQLTCCQTPRCGNWLSWPGPSSDAPVFWETRSCWHQSATAPPESSVTP